MPIASLESKVMRAPKLSLLGQQTMTERWRQFFSLCSTNRHVRSIVKRVADERWVVANREQTAAMLQTIHHEVKERDRVLLRANQNEQRQYPALVVRVHNPMNSQRSTLHVDVLDDPQHQFQTFNTIWYCAQEMPGEEWTCVSRQWALPDVDGKEKETRRDD